MHDRTSWIEHRLVELAEIFSVAVAGFAILDNHLHLLVRLDPDVARGWSDEEVVRRGGRLFPPRDKARQVVPVSDEWVQARLKDARWVATAREREEKGVGNRKTTFLHQCTRNRFLTPYLPCPSL